MIHLIDEMKYDAQTTSNFLDLLDFEVSVWHAEDKECRYEHPDVPVRTPNIDDSTLFEVHGSNGDSARVIGEFTKILVNNSPAQCRLAKVRHR